MPSYFGGAAGSRLVLLVFHPLLRDEQHGRCNHQPAADQIEDRGADATGAGQGSASLVDDVNAATSILSTRHCCTKISRFNLYFSRICQCIVALRSFDFFQILGCFTLQALNCNHFRLIRYDYRTCKTTCTFFSHRSRTISVIINLEEINFFRTCPILI